MKALVFAVQGVGVVAGGRHWGCAFYGFWPISRGVEYLVVAVGGALGAMGRHGLSTFVQDRWQGAFPVGTLAVNLLGCFALGVYFTLLHEREYFSPETRLLVATGILGSLTTFSTFGHETIELMRTGAPKLALGNIGANVVLGMVGVLLGRVLVRAF